MDTVRLETERFVSFDGGVTAVAEYYRPDRYRHIEADLSGRPRIARGGGYSYSAASFGEGNLVQEMTHFSRVLGFDRAAGLIEVEAGATVADVLNLTAPVGLWLPVQPGYPAITIGGCIAANCHGKNPALSGTFMRWVEDLTLFHPKHGTLRVSPNADPEVFDLTCGGYGLTGVILSCRIRLASLPSTRLLMRRIPVGTLAEGLKLVLAAAGRNAFTYTWHDAAPIKRAFGRGIVYDGIFAPGPPATEDVSCRWRLLTATTRGGIPVSLWRPSTIRMFNTVYWYVESARRHETRISLFDSLFPFARRGAYFRLFGRPGFSEYQVLVPVDRVQEFLGELERQILTERAPTVLIALKLFQGKQRLLRFEADAVCVTVNLTRAFGGLAFLRRLDELTTTFGCIPNLIKDSRLPRAVVRACYPEYEVFREKLRAYDQSRIFRSELSERLGL